MPRWGWGEVKGPYAAGRNRCDESILADEEEPIPASNHDFRKRRTMPSRIEDYAVIADYQSVALVAKTLARRDGRSRASSPSARSSVSTRISAGTGECAQLRPRVPPRPLSETVARSGRRGVPITLKSRSRLATSATLW